MVEKSKFTKQSIISKVKKQYGIDIKDIEIITGGSANIYKISSEKETYILKEFQSGYSKELVLKEVRVINHLKSKNLNVPEYIKCLNGEYSFNYKEREVIMQKYIEGKVKKPNTGNKKDLLENAQILANIINALKDYPYDDIPHFNMDEVTSDESLKAAIIENNELIKTTKNKQIIQDLKDKNEIISKLLNTTISSDINKITILKTHGDFGIIQLIYGKETTVIDFATARELPIIREIIRSYACADKDCIDGNINIDNLILYVKEFTKYIELNKYDLKYMAYVYLLRLTSSAYGYKQYLNNGNEDLLRFGKWRTNLCRYLINNYEKIGETLQSQIMEERLWIII